MMERVVVPALEQPARLDRFCARALERIPSRAFARKVIKRGGILLNGEVVESSRFVREGDEVVLVDTGRRPARSFELPLSVAYEDDHLAVVDKPAGIPTSGLKHRTLEHALPPNLRPSPEHDALPRPRVVHRLDVRTQGLVLCAKTARAQVGLGRAFEQRQVRKRYRALALGELRGEGRIDQPVGGRDAVTRWRSALVTPSLTPGALSSVDLCPETGRTHQLRQHLASLGHPILGDEVYTPGKVLRHAGLFLAATGLELAHPLTGAGLQVDREEPAKFAALRRRELRRHRRHEVRGLLRAHRPADALEEAHVRAVTELLEQAEEPGARDHWRPGHLTASAFVLSPSGAEVLLVHHAKLQRWLQPGGHVEPGDLSLVAAARREVREETGAVELDGAALLDVDVHRIPARRDEPAHDHHDLRFLFRARSREVEAGDGVTAARWVPLDEVDEPDESLQRALRKLRRGGAAPSP